MKIYVFLVYIVLYFANSGLGQEVYSDTVLASYYAKGFNGRLTAHGERWSNSEFTAAHKTLPYNTLVKVTNIHNNKSVIVRINDRGPFTKKRAIDLSYAAAYKIGMIQQGIAKVTIEVLVKNAEFMPHDSAMTDVKFNNFDIYGYKIGSTYDLFGKKTKPKGYGVQIFNTNDPQDVPEWVKKMLQQNMQDIFTEVTIVDKKINYNIIVGAYTPKDQAGEVSKILKNNNIDCYIKKHEIVYNGNRSFNNKTIRKH